jgi:hypothetical protein
LVRGPFQIVLFAGRFEFVRQASKQFEQGNIVFPFERIDANQNLEALICPVNLHCGGFGQRSRFVEFVTILVTHLLALWLLNHKHTYKFSKRPHTESFAEVKFIWNFTYFSARMAQCQETRQTAVSKQESLELVKCLLRVVWRIQSHALLAFSKILGSSRFEF